MIDLFEKCAKPSLAAEAKRLGIYPYFHALESKQDVEVIMEGKRRIMLGSNNYLGLTTDPAVVEAGVKALEQYGTGCSGSRFLNGTLPLHLPLEAELAAAEQGEQSGADQGDAQGTGSGLEAGQEGGTAAQYGQPEAHPAQTEPGAVFFPGIVVPGSGIGGGGEGRLHGRGGSFLRRTAGLVLIL